MSFFKKLGEGIKSVSTKVAHSVKEYATDVQRNQKKRNTYKSLKIKLLKQMTLSDFKKICKEFGAGAPSLYEEDILTGKRRKINETERNLYGYHILRNVSLDQLITFARKRNFSVNEVIKIKKECDDEYEATSRDNRIKDTEDVENPNKKTEEESAPDVIDSIFKEIDDDFEFESISRERELEQQLYQFIRVIFKNKHKIEPQYKIRNGTIDLCIDGEYGIEIKIAENSKILENLLGQVHKYCKYFGKGKVGIIILETKNTNLRVLEENVSDYESIGAKVLVLGAQKGRFKRKVSNIKHFILDTRKK